MRRLLLLLLALPPLAVAAPGLDVALEPGAVDADWSLAIAIRASGNAEERAPSTWRATWTGEDATSEWSEQGPVVAAGPDRPTTAGRLGLRYGPGEYRIVLEVVGREQAGTSPPIHVVVAEPDDPPATETAVSATVPDDPLRVRLTSDPVNDDGKQKRPGETLLTRARVEDANGLADLARVTFEVRRGAETFRVDEAALPEDRSGRTTVDLEHSFAATPLAAGDYAVRVAAWNASGEAASVTRTFRIRAVAPDAGSLDGFPADTLTESPQLVRGEATAASRNWERGDDVSGVVLLRVYRGTSPVSWEGTLGNVTGRTPLVAPAAGTAFLPTGERGATRLPFEVTIPAGLNATYRATFAWAPNATATPTTLAAATFRAEAPPVFTRFEATTPVRPGAAVGLRVAVEPGARFERIEIAGAGVSTTVSSRAADVELPIPRGLPAGSVVAVTAEAYAAGRVAATRRLELPVENLPPEATLVATLDGVRTPRLRLLPSSPHRLGLTVTTADANGDEPVVESVVFENASGQVVARATSPVAREEDGPNVIDLPAGIPPGRYRVVARVRDEAGATTEAAIPALVGRWASVRAPSVGLLPEDGALAGDLLVENAGNVPVRGILVVVAGGPTLSGTAHLRLGEREASGEPLVLSEPLAPGSSVTLRLRIESPGGFPAGRHEGRLRVVALPEGSGWS